MDKIKGFWSRYFEEVMVSLIIVLVASSSYFLGRSSVAMKSTHPAITVEEARAGEVLGTSTKALPTKVPDSEGVDATMHGKKYYLPWCTTVAKLAANAKRHFATRAAAEAAGLTPAKNCAGL